MCVLGKDTIDLDEPPALQRVKVQPWECIQSMSAVLADGGWLVARSPDFWHLEQKQGQQQ